MPLKNIISRRSWLKEAGLFASGIFLQDTIKNLIGGTAKRDVTVLVVSGWQDINIGNIAHTPAFYLRQPDDTIKGQMYYDLGLKDWIFEIEQSSGKLITDRLMDISVGPANADQKIKELKKIINDLINKSIEIFKAV